MLCKLSVAAVMAAACGQAVAIDYSFTPIALSGTSGPLGPGSGSSTFVNLSNANPAINNAGQAIFRADSSTISSAGNPGSGGVWIHSGGANGNIAALGTAAPDGGGVYSTSGFNNTIINESGDWAFRSGAASSSAAGSIHASGGNNLIGRSGQTAPGTGGATFLAGTNGVGNASPLFNNNGQVAMPGILTTGSGSPAVVGTGVNADSNGLWIGTPGSVSLVVRQNAVYPDPMVSDVRLGAITGGTSSSVAFNDGGRVMFYAALQGTVSTVTATANNHAVFTYTPSSATPLQAVARRGDAAPGTAGEFYANIGTTLGMNNAGRVVFSSSLRNAAGTTTSSGALFSDTTGSLTVQARGTSPMPAITGAVGGEFTGVNWGTSFTDMVINSAGTVAFKNSSMTGTGITSGNSSGIFKLDSAGVFSKVMRQGDQAPQGSLDPSGAVFFGTLQGGLNMNALGQVAFYTFLTGDVVTGLPDAGATNRALFVADEHGEIAAVARTNTPFEVAPGDIRTVLGFTSPFTSGGEDGRATMLNDNGQLVFGLQFTDGTSGVFMMQIPAPGAGVALGLGGLLAARRRRR